MAIESKTSRTITVSWKPGFNGNSEIISYTVRISENDFNYRDANCQGWSNSSCTVSGLDTNATLEGLRPFTTYFLRVYAGNKVGQSDESSEVKTVTDEEGKLLVHYFCKQDKTNEMFVLRLLRIIIDHGKLLC